MQSAPPSTGTPAIDLKSVGKSFVNRSWRDLLRGREPVRVQALADVSLTVRAGEIFGLLGPNGAGKTTLIKILATLILPDTGTVHLCGHDAATEAAAVRRLIGLVNTSERSFYWRLTGAQNLQFFAALYGLNGTRRLERVREILALLDLTAKADTSFMKYSTGQQQRLAIGRALLADPPVLLMDEPTRSLDPIAAAELRRLVTQQLVRQQGRTVVWCTHNLAEAEEVCDRIAFINHGRVAACGSLAEMGALADAGHWYRLKTDFSSEDLLRQLGITPHCHGRYNGHLVLDIQAREPEVPAILQRLSARGGKIFACNPRGTELEEIFTRLAAGDPRSTP